jgi:hypothetical protein
MFANAPHAEVIQLTPARDDARQQMVARMRERYLDGTLDEILIPEGAELPPALLQAILSHD